MSKKEEKAWRKGVWQFLLDHSTVTVSGYKIFFLCKDPADLWRRVRAREKGMYKREDMKKLLAKQKYREKEYQRLKQAEFFNERHTKKMLEAWESGGVLVRSIFKLKKIITRYLEKKAYLGGEKKINKLK